MEKSKINVLFVDDEIYDDEIKKESYKIKELEKNGDIKVYPVLDGTETLKYLRENKPDIIILDIMMPPGEELASKEVKRGLETGFVLLDEIIENMRLQIPIIVLTNYPKIPIKNYKSVVEYLAKPVKMSKLAELIRTTKKGVND
jgi:CheY-like chemotaxis protein